MASSEAQTTEERSGVENDDSHHQPLETTYEQNDALVVGDEDANGNFGETRRPCLQNKVSPVEENEECPDDNKMASSIPATETEADPPSSGKPPPFAVGDHVYQWCKIVGIPTFQHHGIVMGVHWDATDSQWLLHISDFSNIGLQESEAGVSCFYSNPFSQEKKPGGWRSYASPASKWNKVIYKANWWQKAKSPSGTCTSAECDPPGVVQARVYFLQEHSATLLDMPYHWLHANCGCVAVWCKTGTWATLQALSLLASTAAGYAKSTAVLAGTAATTQVAVTAPAAGLWGWMGFTTTTQVSLLAAQPWLIPALATYGVMTIGIPAVMIQQAHKNWQAMTEGLNDEFWAHAALDNHDVFVECIQYWRKEKS